MGGREGGKAVSRTTIIITLMRLMMLMMLMMLVVMSILTRGCHTS